MLYPLSYKGLPAEGKHSLPFVERGLILSDSRVGICFDAPMEDVQVRREVAS